MNGRKWLLFLLFQWVLQDDSLNLKCVKSNMKNSYCHCILKYILLKICIKLSFWCHQGISSNYSIEFIQLVLFGHDQMTFIVKYLLFYNFFFGVANIANLSIINFVNNNVVWMHQNQLRWKINKKIENISKMFGGIHVFPC